MRTYPEGFEVIADLGDKIVEGLAESIERTRDDLRSYRDWRPDIVADHTERGLANWLHDRVWRHLTTLLDAVPNVYFRDTEPIREFYVYPKYRFRMKRHGEDGTVRSYPTQAVLEFMEQPMLDGDVEIRLIAGYEWDRDARTMGAAVVSLHDGEDNVVWMERLPAPGRGRAVTVPVPPVVGPAPPMIDLAGDAASEGRESEGR